MDGLGALMKKTASEIETAKNGTEQGGEVLWCDAGQPASAGEASWVKDQEKTLQGQNRLNLEVQSVFITRKSKEDDEK